MEFRLSQDFYPILTLIFDEIIILRAKNDEFTIGIETLLYDTELLSTASKYVAHKTIKKLSESAVPSALLMLGTLL